MRLPGRRLRLRDRILGFARGSAVRPSNNPAAEAPRARVLLDAFWLYGGPPSGRSVVQAVVDEWVRADLDDVTLLVPAGDVTRALAEYGPRGAAVRGTRLRPHALAVIFYRGNHDVVVTQNFTSWWCRGRTVTFVHDVIFRRHPEWFSRPERAYTALIGATVRRAAAVVTSSEAERTQIEAAFPSVRGRVTASGLGPAPGVMAADPVAPEGIVGLEGFVLAVGRLNVRKNLATAGRGLLDAELLSPRFPLLIVGETDGRPENLQATERAAVADGRIRFLGGVGDGQLAWLYRHCSAFVFPSLDEAFGLPVLEATSFGARVALSDIAAFREFGDVGEFFDPHDPADIARAVRAAMSRADAAVSPPAAWPTVVGRLRHVACPPERNSR